MAKIIIYLILSLIILLLVNIIGCYLTNYPDSFRLVEIIKFQLEWKFILIFCLIIFIISLVISLLIYKKKKIIEKTILLMVCFYTIGVIITLTTSVYNFFERKKEFDELLTKFKKKAEIDIKNDKVKYFSSGLKLPQKKSKLIKIDSVIEKIHNKFGIFHSSLGCTIHPGLYNAEKEYYKITDKYLEKRNEKNWKAKMKSEIDSINKLYQ